MPTNSPYQLTLSLNALHHLGINLYSNTSAVVAEAVANAWDADATTVTIDLDASKGTISIQDNGHGMSLEDANAKFLTVGYPRREREEAVTKKFKRPVMGRKGIGKLSLFSIAREIDVHTVRDEISHGFRLELDAIEKAIKGGNDTGYKPPPIPTSEINIKEGTRIRLHNLKKSLTNVEAGLKKRIARRFSVIGDQFDFTVIVNGQPVKVEDRDYFHKVQYLWYYGDESKKYVALCKKVDQHESRNPAVSITPPYYVSGWIGSVEKAGDLKDGEENINKIVVMVRGKLAHEDILEEINEGGVYSKYLIGEITADFLDVDNEPDIATSSRQKIIEDDTRYVQLRSFINKELKHIQNKWTELRNAEGSKKALIYPEVKEWFESLSKSHKKLAERLFGKLNQLPLDDKPDDKRTLYKQSIIAFQAMTYKEKLEELDAIDAETLPQLAEILGDIDELDRARYYLTIKERLEVIKILREKVKKNALEKVIQEHLFSHLWLLDPGWERATDISPSMEESVATAFEGVKLTADEKASRLDIRYKMSAGEHIIVELKRPERICSTEELIQQVRKYKRALEKCLKDAGEKHPQIKIIIVIGTDLSDWADGGKEESDKIFDQIGARVIKYQQLIANAEKAYGSYLKASKSDSALAKVIEGIDTGKIFKPSSEFVLP